MRNTMKFKFTGLVIILILIAILMPGNSVPSVGIPGMDKVVHFGMFFTLAGTFYFEYFWHNKKLPLFWIVICSIAVFAFSTEIMQLFADSRSFDLKDFAADMIGCVTAAGLWIGGLHLNRSSKNKK